MKLRPPTLVEACLVVSALANVAIAVMVGHFLTNKPDVWVRGNVHVDIGSEALDVRVRNDTPIEVRGSVEVDNTVNVTSRLGAPLDVRVRP